MIEIALTWSEFERLKEVIRFLSALPLGGKGEIRDEEGNEVEWRKDGIVIRIVAD